MTRWEFLQLAGVHPADLLALPAGGFAPNSRAQEERQEHRAINVPVLDLTELARGIEADADLFLKLATERLFAGFPGLDLPAGKLPAAFQMLAGATSRHEREPLFYQDPHRDEFSRRTKS